MLRHVAKFLFLALTVAEGGTAIPANLTIFGSAYTGGSDNASTLYKLSPGSGAATTVGAIGFTGVGSLAFSPTGTLFGAAADYTVEDSFLITVNPVTGQGSKIGYLGIHDTVQDLTFRSDGTLFGYDGGGDLFTVNTSTGVATILGNSGEDGSGNALAFSGGTLYFADDETPPAEAANAAPAGGPSPRPGVITNGSLQILSQTNGSASLAAPLSFPPSITGDDPRINGMKFDSNGNLWASIEAGFQGEGATTWYLGLVNLNGTVTEVGQTVNGLNAVAVTTQQIGGGPPGAPGAPALSDWALVATAILLAISAKLVARRMRA